MHVRVQLLRERGEHRMPFDRRAIASGDLLLTWRTANDRKVPALTLLHSPAEWPRLYEPRLVLLSGSKMRFLGFERCGVAWVLQEWDCETA